MRRFAMRFRSVLGGHSTAALGRWRYDAQHRGVYAMKSFTRPRQNGWDAVQNALAAGLSAYIAGLASNRFVPHAAAVNRRSCAENEAELH